MYQRYLTNDTSTMLHKCYLFLSVTNISRQNLQRNVVQVPFEDVLDLVGRRAVVLHKGNAFVPSSQLSSIVVGRFRTCMSKALAVTHKVNCISRFNESYRLSPFRRCLPSKRRNSMVHF